MALTIVTPKDPTSNNLPDGTSIYLVDPSGASTTPAYTFFSSTAAGGFKFGTTAGYPEMIITFPEPKKVNCMFIQNGCGNVSYYILGRTFYYEDGYGNWVAFASDPTYVNYTDDLYRFNFPCTVIADKIRVNVYTHGWPYGVSVFNLKLGFDSTLDLPGYNSIPYFVRTNPTVAYDEVNAGISAKLIPPTYTKATINVPFTSEQNYAKVTLPLDPVEDIVKVGVV